MKVDIELFCNDISQGMFSVSQLSEIFNITEGQVRRWINEGIYQNQYRMVRSSEITKRNLSIQMRELLNEWDVVTEKIKRKYCKKNN